MRLRTTSWLVAAVFTFGLFGVACSSSDSGGEATAAPLASPDDLESFRFELIAEITSDGGGGGGAPGLSVDLNASAEASGAVIAPDRQQSTVKADLGFINLDIETISIGDRSWNRESGGEWSEAGAGNGLSDLGFDLSPADVLGSSDDADFQELRDFLAAKTGVRDDVNGVDAVRYDLTLEDLEAQIAANPDLGSAADLEGLEELTLAVWLERDSGIPVRFLLDAVGSQDGQSADIHMELNLTDLNSDSIEIEPPV